LMKKVVIVCGSTSTGKTKLGIRLARKFKGEIISADSRQVYQGMDIGTGKDLPLGARFKKMNSELKVRNKKHQVGYYLFDQVPVWLLDVVSPKGEFSAADYIREAGLVIDYLHQQGKLPILVGGTGFYIKGVINGIGTLGIPPDWKLRFRLEKLSIKRLFQMLTRLDSIKAASLNRSDRFNPRRLIRAIEVAQKKPFWRRKGGRLFNRSKKKKAEFDVLFVGLRADNEVLYQRIDKRVEKRVKQGLEKEIEKLLKEGNDWRNSVLGRTIAYQEWEPFLKGRKSREKMIKRWQFSEHSYARRQMTWFKKDKRIHWFEITKNGFEKKVETMVERWYSERQKINRERRLS